MTSNNCPHSCTLQKPMVLACAVAASRQALEACAHPGTLEKKIDKP